MFGTISGVLPVKNGRRLALHQEGFAKLSGKEGAMVSFSDLFQFGILMVAIIGFVYKITKK